jgi:hypothetical protein
MNIDGNNILKPFDQDLNTTDNVNFARVDVSGAIVDDSQLATKLYVDTHGGGGGGGNMRYVGTTPATNYIYKALASNGHDAVKSTITDDGSTVSIGADCIANKFVKYGGTVNDILLGNGSTTQLTNVNSNTGLSYELAPRGVRDNWVDGVGVIGGAELTYFNSQNMLFSTANKTKISYSTNGGLTWADATGTSTSVLFGYPAYNASIGQYLVIGGSGVSAVGYTSTNGIAWTATTSPTYYNMFTQRLIYFNGNFILNIVNPGFNVSTSPTGAVWTSRSCVNDVYRFCVGYDDLGVSILVASGSNMSYSYDGTTWASGTGSVINGRAVSYSSTRKEWIAFSNSTFQFYTSINGKNWTALSSATTYGGLNTMLWVDDDVNGIPINMYYFVITDSVSGTYSLVYSPSCKDGTFRNIKMNGSNTNVYGGSYYSLIYMPLYDRFALTVNGGTYFRYASKTLNSSVNGNMLSSGFVIPNSVSTTFLKADGTVYTRNSCISPFGAPLEQTGTSNFAGSAYSVQSFLMPESLDVVSLIMNRSVVTSLTISVAIYNSSLARLFTSTLTATTASTLTFPVGVGLTGGAYYYFAVYAPNTPGYYAGTKAGGTIVNSGLNASLQYSSFNVSSTTLPATLPTTGILVGAIIQPPFTLVGY